MFKATLATLLYLATTQYAHAQVDPFEATLAKEVKRIQVNKPEFRLIRKAEDFPQRINATQTFTVVTSPDGAITALHDLQTGAPIESCETPCQLNIDSIREYVIVTFSEGHIPDMRSIMYNDLESQMLKLPLGPNFYESYAKGYLCHKKIESAERLNADAEPCLRIPAIMPYMAKRSGHCYVEFDVTAQGKTEGIIAKDCTEDVFRESSEIAVKSWIYLPKMVNGRPIRQPGERTRIAFVVTDEAGETIPLQPSE